MTVGQGKQIGERIVALIIDPRSLVCEGLVNKKLSIYAVPALVNKFVFGRMALAERKRPPPREVCRD